MKLKDIDIDLSELETDIINTNIKYWIRTVVVDKLADAFIKDYREQLMTVIEIPDNDELRKRVLEKMADEIIENWKERYDINGDA